MCGGLRRRPPGHLTNSILILILLIVQMQEFCDCRGFRLLKGQSGALPEDDPLHTRRKELLRKYFANVRSRPYPPPPRTSSPDNLGFGESKRTVPSCPDPLHN
ncbi:hypothetical protein MLD38_005484 [Melastoma candidum]|uniref:Uncharacterized protein n=1 Tax=Melastoma candidum TaxID=119954 RepID=A0ACB9RJX4_9MYRT|nr:hypothetical protein MLD38_005484 [Melastoma candidum]